MIAAHYRETARKCRLNASLNMEMILKPAAAVKLADMLERAAQRLEEIECAPTLSRRSRIRRRISSLLIFAGVVGFLGGMGGSAYFHSKGQAEAAIELARNGASAAAIDCVLRPELPFFNGRCRAILDQAEKDRKQ